MAKNAKSWRVCPEKHGEKQKRLKAQLPDIIRVSGTLGPLAAAEEFDVDVSTIQRHLAAYEKSRGEFKKGKGRLSVNWLFLHQDGQSCWESFVGAVVRKITTLETKLATKEEEWEREVTVVKEENEGLRSRIEELTSPERDQDALLVLLEKLKEGE